jgi:hypothetical protein
MLQYLADEILGKRLDKPVFADQDRSRQPAAKGFQQARQGLEPCEQ